MAELEDQISEMNNIMLGGGRQPVGASTEAGTDFGQTLGFGITGKISGMAADFANEDAINFGS